MPTPKQEATALRQVLADNFRLVATAEIGTTVHKKVADHYGLSQGTVGRVLGGKTGVTLETLGQLAAALSCQPWMLLIPWQDAKSPPALLTDEQSTALALVRQAAKQIGQERRTRKELA